MYNAGYASGFGKNRGKSARFRPRSPGKTRRIRLIPFFWSIATHAPGCLDLAPGHRLPFNSAEVEEAASFRPGKEYLNR